MISLSFEGHGGSCGDIVGIVGGSCGDLLTGGFAMNIGKCSVMNAELWGIFQGLSLAWDQGYSLQEGNNGI